MSNQTKYNFEGATFIHGQQIFGDHAMMLIHPEAEKVKALLATLYQAIAQLPVPDQAVKKEALIGLTGMAKELAKTEPQQDQTTLARYWQNVLQLLSITGDLASVTSLAYSLGQLLGLPLP